MTTLAVRAVGGRELRPWVPLTPAVLLVLTAIAYPLTSGAGRDAVSWTIVVLGACLSVLHASLSRGARVGAGVALLVTTTAVAVEAVGLATGFVVSRAVDYSGAIAGLLIGSIVLAVITFRHVRRVLSELDYSYYAAF